MIFETIVSDGLAHLSHVIGDDGSSVSVAIGPRRDIGEYVAIANRHVARIVLVLETHTHADSVSGSRHLAARTGAPIFLSADADWAFPHETLGSVWNAIPGNAMASLSAEHARTWSQAWSDHRRGRGRGGGVCFQYGIA